MGGWMPYVRFRGRNGLTWRAEPGENPYPDAETVARVSVNPGALLGDLNRMEQSYMGTYAHFGDAPLRELAEQAGTTPEVARAVLRALFYDTTNGYVMPAPATDGDAAAAMRPPATARPVGREGHAAPSGLVGVVPRPATG